MGGTKWVQFTKYQLKVQECVTFNLQYDYENEKGHFDHQT